MLTAALLLMSVASCSSGDEEEEEYAPVESPFAELLREKPVCQLSYSRSYDKGFFSLQSDPMEGNFKNDYYGIGIIIYDAPQDDMYDGRYEVMQVDASVWGWKE